jgi:hypothetical protein
MAVIANNWKWLPVLNSQIPAMSEIPAIDHD